MYPMTYVICRKRESLDQTERQVRLIPPALVVKKWACRSQR
jgi:hypothetical protein